MWFWVASPQGTRRRNDADLRPATLGEARIAGTISYRRVSGPEQFVQQLAPALAHWFNHQTHHRGQTHALLTGLGQPATELDLLFFQREQARAASPA